MQLTCKDLQDGGSGDHINLKAFLQALRSFQKERYMKLVYKWEEAGIWPFDEEKIRSRMDRVLGSAESTSQLTARLRAESAKTSVVQGGTLMKKLAQTAVHDIKATFGPPKKARNVRAPEGQIMSGRELREYEEQTRVANRKREAKREEKKHLKEMDRQLERTRKQLGRVREKLKKFNLKTGSCYFCGTEWQNDEEVDGVWKECSKCSLFSFCEKCLGGDQGE